MTPDLWEWGASRHEDPETSKDAAESVNATHLEMEVFSHIVRCGMRGATWDEVTEATGIDKVSVSPRFVKLIEKGLIVVARDAAGHTLKRPGKSGRGQKVHVVRR